MKNLEERVVARLNRRDASEDLCMRRVFRPKQSISSAPLFGTILSGLLSLLLLVSSCSPERGGEDSLGGEAKRKKVELIVGGAASLKDAFEEMGTTFRAAHPDIDIRFSFAGSNVLARQVESGAPIDLIAVAAEDILDHLDSAQLLLQNSRREFARNQLCILLPEKSRLSIPDISYLGKVSLQHIAIAAAGVPVRLYSEEALREAGLWEELLPQFVYGGNVRQVLSYVERGEVDCGLVYTSDAQIAKGTRIACVVDSLLHSPIRYPAAIVRTSPHPKEAQLFLNYLTSPEAGDVLQRYGFALPTRSEDR